MHRILVVDADPTNAKLLRFLLTDEGYEVVTAKTPTEALANIDQEPVNLIILDTALPEMDGLQLCCEIRLRHTMPIMFVSAQGEVKDKVTALRAGADDYVVKPFDPNEVLARTWALLRRGSRLANSEANQKTADFLLDLANNKVTLRRTGKVLTLTPIETRLLHFLMSHPGRTLTRDAMVIKVWGHAYESSSNQIDVYMSRLRNKIEEKAGTPRLLSTVRGIGYKYQPSS